MAITANPTNWVEDGTLTLSGTTFSNRTLFVKTDDGSGETFVEDGVNELFSDPDRPNTIIATNVSADTIDLTKIQVDIRANDGFTDNMTFTGSTLVRNVLIGGFGQDTLTGGNQNDEMNGGGNNDTLSGGDGNDVLSGSSGNDTITGGAGADDLVGGPGNDTFDYVAPSHIASGELVTGGADTDTVRFSGAIDFQVVAFTSIERLQFNNTGVGTAQFGSNQFGGTGISSTVDIVRDPNAILDQFRLILSSAGSFSAAGWTFSNGMIDILSFRGTSGDDTITGSSQADRIEGLEGVNHLIGGGGDDSFFPGSGFAAGSHYNGEGGTDDISINAAASTFLDFSAGTLTSIEELAIGNGGNGGTVVLRGSQIGLAGGITSVFNIGVGSPTLIVNANSVVDLSAVTFSGSFTITINGTAAADTLTGSSRADTILGGGSADQIFGNGGADLLIGGAGADQISGGTGQDSLDYSNSPAGVSVDLAGLTGVGGDAQGDTYVQNVATNDVIEDVIGSAFADTITGSDIANNKLNGLGGDDELYGNNGNDTLIGGNGADRLAGGNGTDIADYSSSDAAVVVNLLTKTGTGGHAQGDHTFSGIENILGSQFADTLIGDNGPNQLDGGGDSDTLIGGLGADKLFGGLGIDLADYIGSTVGVSVDLFGNTGAGGEAQSDTFFGTENVRGSAFDDTITGDGNDNRLFGLGGNDELYGNEGADTLLGGPGADKLSGGTGQDVVDYSGSPAGVSVDLVARIGAGGDAQGDFHFGNMDDVIGSAFGDTITGDNAGNRLIGLGGNDELYGNEGNDTLLGGAGADKLSGGTGQDLADYSNSPAGVAVDLLTRTGQFGDAQGDHNFGNIEDLTGSAFGDQLSGDNARNRLTGGAGEDELLGRGGADMLFGGSAADQFIYTSIGNSLPGAIDVIVDFNRAERDKIDLFDIDASTLTGGNQAFSFIGNGAFTGVAGQLRFAGGFVEGDVTGDGAADLRIQVNIASLTATDFIL